MKEVILSKGNVMCIDDCDFDLIKRFKWWSFKSRKVVYAQADVGGRCYIFAHRLILGATKGQIVDHIDGNGLNNTRNNLRLCSASQNSQHARMRKDNTTGYRGVTKLGDGYTVRIRVSGIRKYLGYYGDIKEAAQVYNDAAKQYHKEFATLNTEGK